MEVTKLLTEYEDSPIGVGRQQPVLSWNVKTGLRDWKQTAYRVIVAENEADLENETNLVWDSQKIKSDRMNHKIGKSRPLVSDHNYFWRVQVWGHGRPWACSGASGCISGVEESAQATGRFKTALLEASDWHGTWIGEVEDHVYHIFRKTFTIDGDLQCAGMYICGLGHFELYVNGSRCTDEVLESGWSNYDKSCQYSCYDVTRLLGQGDNGLGVILGDGMYNVPGGRYVYFPRSFGKCKFLLQLNLTYTDGSRQEIVSGTDWFMAPSALTFSCIYGGEDFDARLKKRGFSGAAYQMDDSWKPAVAVNAPKGRLIPRLTPPLKVMDRYETQSVRRIGDGKYLCDLGTNFSGWIRAELTADHAMTGHTVTFTPAELLDDQGLPDQRVTGKGYGWTYIMDGEKYQTYHPRFTYTGFRYVLVENAVPSCADVLDPDTGMRPSQALNLPVLTEFLGEFIYPDRIENGGFWCDSDLFNRIHQMICQAILSNTKNIFTDCPHREKLGWLEQTHLIGPSIMYNYNVHNLYEKIEQDMEEAQYENGLIPDICPQYVVFGYHEGFNDSPEWGSALIINPWYMYKRFGDKEIFSRYYGPMKKYMDYLTSRTHHHILHHGLGDWLDIGPMTPWSQNTPVPVVATNIYYYDLKIMSFAAQTVGREADAKAYRQLMAQVFEEYNLQFYDDQTGRYANGSQAAQAMSLVTGLVPEDQVSKVLDVLVRDICSRDYQTTAEDIGHPFVMAALMQYGRSDLIDRMTGITDRPGYGYQVACKATTLTEEWDGPDPKRPHGSQNHFMLGSVEEWFYGGLAGIYSIRTPYSFDEIQIRPYFSQSCNHVQAWTMHPYGKLSLNWKRSDNKILLDFEIPPNATAVFINDLLQTREKLGSGSYHYEFEE